MIVAEKRPRYLAFTWQEFLAGIDALSNFLPAEAMFYGRRCVLNDTKTGYFVYDKDGLQHIMNEDSVLLFYGCNNLNTAAMSSEHFWNTYEQVIWK